MNNQESKLMDNLPYILLADDDMNDCQFFREALESMSFSVSEKVVNDGNELMLLLANSIDKLPQVLFLDLNMPLKNGFQCLTEIKNDSKFENIPVVIISNSYDPDVAEVLYRSGASYFIRKPIGFSQQQELISLAIRLITIDKVLRPEKEMFFLGAVSPQRNIFSKSLARN